MVTDKDLIKLYSQRILALAAEIPFAKRLDSPDSTASVRSPLCGSIVTVDLSLSNGKVAKFGQDVKACALGQAAASVVGANILGKDRDAIEKARNQLYGMLKNDGPEPAQPFQDLAVLKPAREYKNRHASIMLAFDATLAAFDRAAKVTKQGTEVFASQD
ncbi:MAG: iron-sulfur cluster assembly scaffold protein [Albidovulum sp.]|nr:iron-sulfur cluster assembly scaffold protein [Albidovulum sp.]MDE0532889.1 iron-sulfur cluster assembly scaffold protein [Albidovulum sp.]